MPVRATLLGRLARRPSRRGLGLFVAGLAVIAVCLGVRQFWGASQASAQAPAGPQGVRQASTAPPEPTSKAVLKEVAVVNGEVITRQQLASECTRRFGPEVLDSLIHKQLISDYCTRNGIQISDQEVQEEIARVAHRFHVPLDQWLKMLEQERGINPTQYANDIIWPTLALRKAAKGAMDVTEEELRAAHETQYGPAVEARLIVCLDADEAAKIREQAAANPDDFGRLARLHSKDPASAGMDGRIMPIRKNLGDINIERVAFQMQPGDVSQVIPVDNQFVILKCEAVAPSRLQQMPLEGEVRARLIELVRERKEPQIAARLFEKLDQSARIVRVLGDAEGEQRYPGVAAIINNRTITLQHLGEECIRRHGKEVLQATIDRMILEQHCKKANVKVTLDDIQTEVARAADSMGFLDSQGGPDVKAWLRSVNEEQGLTDDRYLDDVVWPTVALKKYVLLKGAQIEVTEQDLQQGFEANYGSRAKCLAIVLNNHRTAQEVWDMARQKPNAVFFGQLARKYSIESQSSSLNGEVPPIQRHGGRPLLEKEAFSLKPGDVSGIIQVGDKFVILYCEGFTKPQEVRLGDVRDDIYKDLHEKKLRLEMAKAYSEMMEQARWDNFLADTRHTPTYQRSGGVQPAYQAPRLEQPPANATRRPTPTPLR